MVMDREKVVRNAQRFKQNKQFQRAIDEYKRVLASDSRDIRSRQKLIELYALVGQRREAIEECLVVAEAYADQGFYLKAIAVLKQALRLDMESVPLWRQTGEMYVKQGLVGEALAAFKRGVDLLRRQGRGGEAEQLLARMEDLAPDNAAIKVHLAELYLEDGRYEDFSAELSKLIHQLRGEGRSRKLLQALESFYEKSHRHSSVLRRLAELYVDLGEEVKALQVLAEGLSREPEDRELRLLALRAHLVLGQLSEARGVALALHEGDPDDLFILEQLTSIAQARGDRAELAQAYKSVARIYGRRGMRQKEDLYFRKVMALDPEDAEARLALGEVVVEVVPEGAEELGIEGFQDPWEAGPTPAASDAVHQGLVEAELYLKYGIEQKAADKLRELTALAPDDLEVRQKLRDLCHRQGDHEGWAAEQLCVAKLFLRGRREAEALRAYQSVLDVDPDNAAARQGIEALRPAAAPKGTDTAELALGADMAQTGYEAFGAAGRGDGGLTGEEESALQQGLSEADFLELQERPAEAVAALLDLRRQFPSSPHVAARLERLGSAGPQGAVAGAGKSGYVDLQAEVLEGMDLKLGSEFEGFAEFEVSELDDIVREFKSGIAESLDEGDYETHYNLGVAYREMGLMEEAAQEFQVAARSPDKTRDAYASLAMVFRDLGRYGDATAALRMALAAPSNTPEDRVAILYELGDTAEAEGDGDRALLSFEKAAELDPGHRDVRARIQRLRSQGGG